MKLRSQACEDAKHEYADQLRKTNEAQRQHYEQRLPHVFKQLQVSLPSDAAVSCTLSNQLNRDLLWIFLHKVS